MHDNDDLAFDPHGNMTAFHMDMSILYTWTCHVHDDHGVPTLLIIIINPCKPYHFGIGTAPHPLGRWRVD
jgi:hypothetical protein